MGHPGLFAALKRDAVWFPRRFPLFVLVLRLRRGAVKAPAALGSRSGPRAGADFDPRSDLGRRRLLFLWAETLAVGAGRE